MRWIWDEGKARSNRRKHRLSFETAQLVFDDPLAQSKPDRAAVEERWLTLGLVGNVPIVVVHTWPDADEDGETGRIISARKATPRERKAYEEGDF
jgi:uncharacterized protein